MKINKIYLLIIFSFTSIFLFNTNVKADEVTYESNPDSLHQLSTVPALYSVKDFDYCSTGLFDINADQVSVSLYPQNNNDIFNLLNDCSNDSFIRLAENSSNYIKVDFIESMDIKAIFYNKKVGINTFYFDFYDKKGTMIKRTYASSSAVGDVYTYVDVQNVHSIKIFSNSGNQEMTELDFVTELSYASVSAITVDVTDLTATLNWKNPSSSNLSHILLDGMDISKSTSFLFKDLESDTEYTKKIVAVYLDGTEIVTNYTFKTEVERDKIAPKNVTELKAITTIDSVTLDWVEPSEDDYEKTMIYRDDVFVKTVTTENTYTDKNLKQDTLYTYKLITVDNLGNKSDGNTLQALTKFIAVDIPPKKVVNLSVKPLSSGARLTWKTPVDKNWKGFNVYSVNSDGNGSTKINGDLITGMSYQISELLNDVEYSFYVVAVNSNGLVSVDSDIVKVTPSKKSVPPVNLSKDKVDENGNVVGTSGFSLKDIADGTSNWFSSLWLILAFAIGIVVAFVVANRVKRLFLT